MSLVTRALVCAFLFVLPLAAQTVRPKYESILFDANGRPVGSVLPNVFYPGAFLLRFELANRENVAVGVSASGYFSTSALYFVTSDCSGQPYMINDEFDAVPTMAGMARAVVAADGSLNLLPDSTNPVTQVSSKLDPFGGMCAADSTNGVFQGPLTRYVDLGDSFTEPFTFLGPPAPLQPTFSDVPSNHIFFEFIELLAASGITGGCGGGKYCPDAPLTRGQMAVFLVTAMGMRFGPPN